MLRTNFVSRTALWCVIAGAALPAAAEERGSATRVESVEADRGQSVYRKACASCHGRSGRGDGPAARALDPKPRDFTSGKYKFRSTPSGMPPTDDDLYRVVTSGIPRTYMFGWGELLSERDRRDVVSYIKTLSAVFEADDDTVPIDIPPEPDATARSVAEGKSMYMVMQCFGCHGAAGRGDGDRASGLEDDRGRAIDAFDFTVGSYKGGSDGASVFRTFETGLNGTPMPSYDAAFLFGADAVNPASFADAYSEDEVLELAAYLESQPSSSALSTMSRAEKERLVAARKWALVHYVKSLSRNASVFHRLLLEDTEVAK